MDTIALLLFSIAAGAIFLIAFGAGGVVSFGSGFGLGAVIVLNELRAH
jgi:hypothetical protein